MLIFKNAIMEKKKLYKHFLPPAAMYAFDLPQPTHSKEDAKQQVRDFYGLKRMPNGTQIW